MRKNGFLVFLDPRFHEDDERRRGMIDMAEKPEILDKKIVTKSRLFQIEEVHLRFSNGEERRFERFGGVRGDGVMVVPLLDNDTVILVREYGVGLETYYLSLPTGAVDPDESFIEAADRELKEEIGYGAKRYKELNKLANSPAYSMRQLRLLVAQDLYEEKLHGDEPEELEVLTWRLSEIGKLLNHPDFVDTKSIAALYIVREMIENGSIQFN